MYVRAVLTSEDGVLGLAPRCEGMVLEVIERRGAAVESRGMMGIGAATSRQHWLLMLHLLLLFLIALELH